MKTLTSYINIVSQGTVLSTDKMAKAMDIMMSGNASNEDIASFLTALATRGEAVSEITGAARVMRQMASAIKAPDNAIDCCGTGGDASGTYNISTAVALVCAGAGVPIAKHGNRAASSKSGAADVLEALGVNLDLNAGQLEQALTDFNFCFLMAPHHHGAMKHVMPARKALGTRTIFNLLGPLANPAGTQMQLIGVFDEKWLMPMAQTLQKLGTKRAWVVHGTDGLDEITTTAETKAVILEGENLTERTFTPEDFGVARVSMDNLKGGDAAYNAAAIIDLLNGAQNAYRDIVLVNAAAVFMITGKSDNIESAMKMGAHSIDSGAALKTLKAYAAFSQESKTS